MGSGAWSRDGTRIAFHGREEREPGLIWQQVDGAHAPEKLTKHGPNCLEFASVWSLDSARVIFSRRCRGSSDIFAIDVDEPGSDPVPVLTEAFSKDHVDLSPDEAWLAYASDESGRFEVYVRAYPSLNQKQQISTGGGTMPAFSENGDELYYLNPVSDDDGEDVMMVVPLEHDPRFEPGTPRELFRGRFLVSVGMRTYDVTRDGRFLMVTRAENAGGAESARIVLNWFQELERLVPTHD